MMDINCLFVYSVTNDENGKENTEETEGISSRMRSLFDVTTLEMTRKPVKLQKEIIEKSIRHIFAWHVSLIHKLLS